ncbi:MAG: GntR family transcriptional regulator [Clostridiales bacterium]|nr:GntR family transcriptional regulator [Clostridiales bacterium]
MAWQFTNDRPVYLQIEEEIQLRIVTGIYAAGSRLPSVRDLAEEAQVNPNTMQKALQELERDELIISQRTTGKFVTDNQNKIVSVRKSIAKSLIDEFVLKMKKLGITKIDTIALINEDN